MKLCLVNPPVLMKRPIAELVERLSDKDYEVSVLTPRIAFRKTDESMHYSKLIQKGKVLNYPVMNPPIGPEQPLPVGLGFFSRVNKMFRENDVIQLWVPYYLTSLYIISVKKFFYPKKKLILTMDTLPGLSFSMGKMDYVFKLYNKLFGRILFKTPDKITLYGKELIPYALKAGVPKEKIVVIPTGIDLNKLSKEQPTLDLPWNKKVLFVGILCDRKGVDTLIKTATKLPDDITFILLGDGNMKKYQKMADKLGVGEKIKFLGWRQDVGSFYKGCDVFFLPARGEGLPGVIMESMTAGIPVVASRIPCIGELITDGKEGFLCDKESPEDFAIAIDALLNNDELRTRTINNAKDKIKLFDWNEIIIKYEELYRSI